jgi:hypothetical protein
MTFFTSTAQITVGVVTAKVILDIFYGSLRKIDHRLKVALAKTKRIGFLGEI